MFYPNYCQTDIQKSVFEALMNENIINVHELDFLGFSRLEILETLKYFESKGLLQNVQHLGGEYPIVFTVK